jgi:hypothetical protein
MGAACLAVALAAASPALAIGVAADMEEAVVVTASAVVTAEVFVVVAWGRLVFGAGNFLHAAAAGCISSKPRRVVQ